MPDTRKGHSRFTLLCFGLVTINVLADLVLHSIVYPSSAQGMNFHSLPMRILLISAILCTLAATAVAMSRPRRVTWRHGIVAVAYYSSVSITYLSAFFPPVQDDSSINLLIIGSTIPSVEIFRAMVSSEKSRSRQAKFKP